MPELSPNHKRALSSTLFLMEKMVREIASTLNQSDDLVMQKTVHDLSTDKKASIRETLELIDTAIRKMATKYQLSPQITVESHFLNARKSKSWEMLHNTKANQLNAFGKFPVELEAEFDADLDILLNLIDQL